MNALENSEIEFRDIPGFPGYRVGSDGTVLSSRPKNWKPVLGIEWRALKPQMKRRYFQVALSIGKGELKWRSVHSLVALAFIGQRPKGHQVNHKDGVKTNNCASNLEYVTDRENKDHAINLGLMNQGERNCKAKLMADQVDDIRQRRAAGERCIDLANEFGVDRNTIGSITRGLTWTGKGVRRGSQRMAS